MCTVPSALAASSSVGSRPDSGLPFVTVRAEPPRLPFRPPRYHRRGQVAVPRGMPLCGDIGTRDRQVCHPRIDLTPGTRGAPGAVGPIAYPCLPCVSIRTEPPHLPFRPPRHHRRRKVTVLRGMPLRGEIGTRGRQVCQTGIDPAPGTRGAPRAVGPIAYPGLPLVPIRTAPPRLPVRSPRHHRRRQGAVLRRVPLGGETGVHGRQVCNTGIGPAPGTRGAPGAVGPTIHLSLPLVPIRTAPPRLPVRSPRHHRRRQGAVLRRVPLGGETGVHGRQVCNTGIGPAPGTRGAPGAVGPTIHLSLPLVPIRTAPPRLPVRSPRHHRRRQGVVLRRVPLGCEIGKRLRE